MKPDAPRRFTVALDVMGADRGTAEIVEGGVAGAGRLTKDAHVILVGDESRIRTILDVLPNKPSNFSIVHATREIPMDMGATESLRIKESSIATGVRLVKEGKADTFVSPGNTGAVMANALLTLGRIEGVLRPAITAIFPTKTGEPTVLLDVGANADCKPQHLSQFAIMGSVYSSVVLNHESPKVGLLSIGEERSKGNELILGALELLKTDKINFVGNVEGRDILAGTVDVVVTDGFTGNIILKFAESIKPFLFSKIQRQIETNIFSRMGVLLLGPFLRRMKKTFDYSEAGGAPLLGINGNVVICHGSSNVKAISNAVVVGCELARRGIIQRIREELETNHFGNNINGKDKSQDSRNGVLHAAAASDQL